MCAPMACAALATEKSDRFETQVVAEAVMSSLQTEWDLILSMESEKESAELLHRCCPHVLHQVYRELMVTLEEERFSQTPRSLAMILAYMPSIINSSNIEQCFNTMADCIARSGKSDLGSMANLQAVHIRACAQKVCGHDGQGRAVVLDTCDWEGHEIRGLRPKLWQPQTFAGSLLSVSLIIGHHDHD